MNQSPSSALLSCPFTTASTRRFLRPPAVSSAAPPSRRCRRPPSNQDAGEEAIEEPQSGQVLRHLLRLPRTVQGPHRRYLRPSPPHPAPPPGRRGSPRPPLGLQDASPLHLQVHQRRAQATRQVTCRILRQRAAAHHNQVGFLLFTVLSPLQLQLVPFFPFCQPQTSNCAPP